MKNQSKAFTPAVANGNLKMSLNKTKKQHFVSQFYLKSWSKNGESVRVKDNKKCFQSATKKIALENHLYRIEGIGSREKEILLKGSSRVAEPMRGLFQTIILSCHQFRILSKLPANENLARTLDTHKQNIIENFYGIFEDLVTPSYIDLINGNYENIDLNSYQDILRFVTLQLTRTSKVKETSKANMEGMMKEKGLEFDDFDTLHSIIIAEHLTLTLIEKLYQLEIVENETEINFITSDNPVKNLLKIEDIQVNLFWPINPRKALIIRPTSYTKAEAENIKKRLTNQEIKPEYILKVNRQEDHSEILKLNKITWENRHRQIYFLEDHDIEGLD